RATGDGGPVARPDRRVHVKFGEKLLTLVFCHYRCNTVSSTEGRTHEAFMGWGGMRYLRVWLAPTSPGGRRANPSGLIRSRRVRRPLNAKAGTPRGAPQDAGASADAPARSDPPGARSN